MFIIICAIIGSIILFDFAIVGYLPRALKIWKPIKGMVDNILIEDTVYYSIRTNMPGLSGRPLITSRINYKSIILTASYLIVKNTRLTCLLSINMEDIIGYTVESGKTKKALIVNFKEKNNEYWIKFQTKQLSIWKKELEALNINKV